MSELLEKCTLAKDAGYKMVSVSTVTKDNTLEAIANALVERADEIIADGGNSDAATPRE